MRDRPYSGPRTTGDPGAGLPITGVDRIIYSLSDNASRPVRLREIFIDSCGVACGAFLLNYRQLAGGDVETGRRRSRRRNVFSTPPSAGNEQFCPCPRYGVARKPFVRIANNRRITPDRPRSWEIVRNLRLRIYSKIFLFFISNQTAASYCYNRRRTIDCYPHG